jgi:hypothetical protein
MFCNRVNFYLFIINPLNIIVIAIFDQPFKGKF